MSSKAIRQASRIPKADMAAALILAEMFRSVMDDEEVMEEEDLEPFSRMLEQELPESEAVVLVEPKEELIEIILPEEVVSDEEVIAPPQLSSSGSEQFVVNGVTDVKIMRGKPAFFVHWGDDSKDWRKFDELAEVEEDGELAVNEKLAEFLQERGMVDADAFKAILSHKRKKYTLKMFMDTSEEGTKRYESWKQDEEVVEAAAGAAAAAVAAVEMQGEVIEPPTQASLRRMDAVSAFIEEVKNKSIIRDMIQVTRSMDLSMQQLARIILYNEAKINNKSAPFRDILEGKLPYLFVLDALNTAIGNSNGSPISMSYRARQITCSESATSESTSADIPTIGSKLRRGVTYAERLAIYLKDKSECLRYLSGILDRSNGALTYLNDATPLARQKMLQKVDTYTQKFCAERFDMRPAFFGIGKDLDPTRTPVNLGDKVRNDILAISKEIIQKNTSLVDESGSPLPFHGAFWNGSHTLDVGTKLGYYEGRIVTECDSTEMHHDRPSEYSLEISKYMVLVDATHASESNWSRYINDGEHGTSEDLCNVRFTKDGSIVTTRPVMPGSELFVRYGEDYWRFFRRA